MFAETVALLLPAFSGIGTSRWRAVKWTRQQRASRKPLLTLPPRRTQGPRRLPCLGVGQVVKATTPHMAVIAALHKPAAELYDGHAGGLDDLSGGTAALAHGQV